MTATTRPCTVAFGNDRVKATWHSFGTESFTDDGHEYRSRPIATVETEDGHVHVVHPSEVKFTDKA